MAPSYSLKPHVLKGVASRAASALAGLDRRLWKAPQPADHERVGPDLRLHESLPIWLINGADLQRLREDHARGPINVRGYLQKTPFWLHLLYRDGEPFGYVHGRQRSRGIHQVTNVSVTHEAALIRKAIDEVDRAFAGEAVRAGILECPKVGLAGVIAFPRRRKDELLTAVFRDPSVSPPGAHEPITPGLLIDRLLQLRILHGPTPPQGPEAVEVSRDSAGH